MRTYKYSCKECGAYIPTEQFICGMCNSNEIIKTPRPKLKEIVQSYL